MTEDATTRGRVVFEFRVTKYNPVHRDRRGSYLRDEWISVDDIGRVFAGVVLTHDAYQRIEDAYAVTAVGFMREAGVESLTVMGLENHKGVSLRFAEGSTLSMSESGTAIRQVLRGEFWCRLESAAGFVHLGYDYYMYVGVAQPCPGAETLARQSGLFVESFNSPYREQGPAEHHASPDPVA
jgi:hypothetical protein